MALVPCHECNKDVSDTADVCPYCGFNLKKFREENNKNKIEEKNVGCLLFSVLFAILLVIMSLVSMINNPKDKEYDHCINICGYLKGQGVYTSKDNVKCQRDCLKEFEKRHLKK